MTKQQRQEQEAALLDAFAQEIREHSQMADVPQWFHCERTDINEMMIAPTRESYAKACHYALQMSRGDYKQEAYLAALEELSEWGRQNAHLLS